MYVVHILQIVQLNVLTDELIFEFERIGVFCMIHLLEAIETQSNKF